MKYNFPITQWEVIKFLQDNCKQCEHCTVNVVNNDINVKCNFPEEQPMIVKKGTLESLPFEIVGNYICIDRKTKI